MARANWGSLVTMFARTERRFELAGICSPVNGYFGATLTTRSCGTRGLRFPVVVFSWYSPVVASDTTNLAYKGVWLTTVRGMRVRAKNAESPHILARVSWEPQRFAVSR